MKRSRRSLPRPTQAELEILRVLWQRGPSSVREVHHELSQSRATGYTTVLKLLQIMTEKGLARRDDRERTHIYEPGVAQEDTQRQLVSDLLERAFDGSSSQLILQALQSRPASREEIEEIRRLLDEAAGGKKS